MVVVGGGFDDVVMLEAETKCRYEYGGHEGMTEDRKIEEKIK